VAESIDIAITQTPNGGTPQTYHMLADSIGFGVTNTAPTGGASGGAGAGKATFAPFTALAQTSATTPVLLQDLESQQKIDQVVVTVSTATGGKGPAMILEQFTLQLVFVTSLKQDVQVGQNVDDQLEFVFGSLKYSFENGSPV
jgi:type VI protein secretion system component Hcp